MRFQALPRQALNLNANKVKTRRDLDEPKTRIEQFTLRIRPLEIAISPALVLVLGFFECVLQLRNNGFAQSGGFEPRMFELTILSEQLRLHFQKSGLTRDVCARTIRARYIDRVRRTTRR